MKRRRPPTPRSCPPRGCPRLKPRGAWRSAESSRGAPRAARTPASSGPTRRFLHSVARFAIPAGLAVGSGIVAGHLLARYGFDLDLRDSRTVATGIVVVCGLAVVMQLETEHGRRRLAVAGVSAAMASLFALALVVPVLRDFYELSLLTGDVIAAWAVGATLGIGGMLGALRVLRV